MSDSVFRFKRFSVSQSDSAGMKVGTDGVLLGAWCTVEPIRARLLDIGTGTGVIALMLAQRAEWAHIDAVEIDPISAARAAANAAASPWAERVNVIDLSLQEFAGSIAGSRTYDHIVSNPPYFTESLLPPSPQRRTARHTPTLSHTELLGGAGSLLSPDGRLSLILPPTQAADAESAAPTYRLTLVRKTDVYSRRGGEVKRTMLEFSRSTTSLPPVRDTLAIHEATGGEFTDEYRELTREFYLKF